MKNNSGFKNNLVLKGKKEKNSISILDESMMMMMTKCQDNFLLPFWLVEWQWNE